MLRGLFNTNKKPTQEITVLVVGDDQEELRFVTNTLEIQGYKTHAVPAVGAALNLLNDMEMPDLFICDFRDPQGDGTEFLRRLNLRYGKASLAPVIFLLDSAEDEQVAHAMGVNDVLAKPLHADALLRCVKSVVTQS